MLTQLQIKNFSIVESAQIEFKQGFHVLSGETGAGKSFLVQAIAFALGARADRDSIRAGAKEAVVTLDLEVPPNFLSPQDCQDLGGSFKSSPAQLQFRRTLNAEGRSRAYLNDQAVSLKILQSLGSRLIHQVGQHAARQLFEEGFLLKILDQLGGHEKLLGDYHSAWESYHESLAKLQRLQENIAKTREQEDFLRFQSEELNRAQLRVGEEAELEQQKQRLKHHVALAAQSFEIAQSLSEGEDALSDRLGQVLHLAQKASALDPALQEVASTLEEALERVDQASRAVSHYVQDLQEDPQALDPIEDRLAQIHELKRKYRLEEAELIAKGEALKQQLLDFADHGVLLKDHQEVLDKAQTKLQRVAKKLHASREQSAVDITKRLKKNLKELSLPHAKMDWEVELLDSLSEYKSNGPDQVTLWVSFNPGEPMRPFQEVLSGGELSRLLLAIYEVLFKGKVFGTFIFDEVDSGVSGSVAELIGRKLAGLSRQAQVLCITHLPQIACQAVCHYVVEKKVQGGRTFSDVRRLKQTERVQEIARMLAGVEVTTQALQHARELLKENAA